MQSLDPKLPQYEHHLYEALGAYATIEAVEPSLLQRLLRAQDSRARAYAAESSDVGTIDWKARWTC